MGTVTTMGKAQSQTSIPDAWSAGKALGIDILATFCPEGGKDAPKIKSNTEQVRGGIFYFLGLARYGFICGIDDGLSRGNDLACF